MKTTQRLALSLVVLGGIALTAGCPGIVPTPTVSPSATSEASAIKGIVTHNTTPQANIDLGIKKYDGASYQKQTGITAKSAENGTYTFTNLADGKYQPMYDDNGQFAQATSNTVGAIVLDPVDVSATQSTAPVSNFELYWLPNSSYAPNATMSMFINGAYDAKITFDAPLFVGTQATEYQILFAQRTASESVGTSVWSSAWTETKEIHWNGKNTSANDVAAGIYAYQIKFRKKGGEYLGGNYYGQTKWYPVTITRS